MTVENTDPRTGFIIRSNEDTWRADQPQLPSAEVTEEPQPINWGTVGQGVSRNTHPVVAPDLAKASDHRYWIANKEAIMKAVELGYYDQLGETKGY